MLSRGTILKDIFRVLVVLYDSMDYPGKHSRVPVAQLYKRE
jgi:hypothetical protein